MDPIDKDDYRLVEDYDPALGRKVAKLWLPILERYHRARFEGLDNLPDSAFLAVGNHSGVHFMPETFLWLCRYHTMPTARPMYTLVHEFMVKLGERIGFPMHAMGILDGSMESARAALRQGCSVTVYPGGDRDNSKPFCERNTIDFFGHTGYVRLALQARVPVVPVVGVGGGESVVTLSSGSAFARITGLTDRFKIHSWPVYWSFPFGFHIGHFPSLGLPLPCQVTISVLPPIGTEDYPIGSETDPEAIDDLNRKVIAAMQAETDRLCSGRIPVLGRLG
jgi:1-acyl-sn-glycerol-3-phosphate acyltransferase